MDTRMGGKNEAISIDFKRESTLIDQASVSV